MLMFALFVLHLNYGRRYLTFVVGGICVKSNSSGLDALFPPGAIYSRQDTACVAQPMGAETLHLARIAWPYVFSRYSLLVVFSM